MTAISRTQLTLNLEPTVIERWPTLRAYIAHRSVLHPSKKQSAIAADMDLSPTVLNKKLTQHEGDGHKFTIDDLEGYIKSTGDIQAVIEYLATKYEPGGSEAREARALAAVEQLLPELQRAVATLNKGKRK
jgi:hypothetical protein